MASVVPKLQPERQKPEQREIIVSRIRFEVKKRRQRSIVSTRQTSLFSLLLADFSFLPQLGMAITDLFYNFAVQNGSTDASLLRDKRASHLFQTQQTT